jgi:lipopolysaccharide transport system ATP-binding protein
VSGAAIRVENLGKMYRIGGPVERYRTFRDTVAQGFARAGRRVRSWFGGGNGAAPKYETIWALKDVSFEIQPGEVVGVIGRNGAGKSTLLKILSRITEPTEGRAVVRGRVGSLLEVGTGFHPELTGRENVYLNGAILGMKRAEVDRKFDEIVAFAEIEKLIDTPVKHYSSGMYLRLAFAVAAHLDPEILLVDEVLAVGDAAFQGKCLGKMKEVGEGGRTILFVSHNMAAIRTLCSRCILIREGRLAAQGDPADIVDDYLQGQQSSAGERTLQASPRPGRGMIRLTDVEILNSGLQKATSFATGERAIFRMHYLCCFDAPTNAHFEVKLKNHFGAVIVTFSTYLKQRPIPICPGQGSIECSVNSLQIAPGRYTVELNCSTVDLEDLVPEATHIDIIDGVFHGSHVRIKSEVHGVVLLTHEWTHHSRA